MSDILIKTENLTRIYKNRNNQEVFGLRNINITVKKGDFISVMGPSGAGKTTLFNLLGLLDKPDFGSICFKGISLKTVKNRDMAKFRNRNIGIVFQNFYLIPNLTIYENAIMPFILDNRGFQEKGKQRVALLFEQLELASKKNSYPNELSGGEQQRASLIRALANEPEVILADEPTGNLDSKITETIFDFFTEMNRSQFRTIIYITHNKELASIAQRIVYLKNGEVTHEQDC